MIHILDTPFCLIILEGKLEAGTSSVDAVISLMQTPGRHSSVLLSEVARVLKPGGDFFVQEPLLADAQELKVIFRAISMTMQKLGCILFISQSAHLQSENCLRNCSNF